MSNLVKKVSSAIAGVSIVMSIVAPIAGVSAGYDGLDAANKLAGLGIIVDQSSNPSDYRLGDTLTRRENAKTTIKLAGLEVSDTCEGKYSDMPSSDWGCKYAEAGLLAGFFAPNAKFNPTANVSKGEALKMAMKARGIMPTAGITPWQAAYVDAAVAAGITESFSDYNAPATRSNVFTWASNIIAMEEVVDTTTPTDDTATGDTTSTGGDDILAELLGGLDDTTTSDSGSTTPSTTTTSDSGSTTPSTTVTTGNLAVSLNPASATSKSIPSSGVVTFGKFDFTAGTADTTVNSIKFSREGLGNRSDISRVWMEKNGVRISGRQTVGSDNMAYVTFSPAFVVKAGGTESLDLIVSLSASGSTNSQHKFTINSASDIDSTASISGSFPLSTATMTTTSYAVSNVAFVGAGSASTYRAGDKNVELGQFKLTNNATDDKSVSVKSITLRNDGTANAGNNLSNIAIFRNGNKVSSGVTFDGKNITVELNDTVLFGRTETYYIRADVNTVELTAGDTYKFTLRYSDDINVSETITGFKANITGVSSSVSLAQYTVSGGDLILSKSTTSPSSQTVAPGTNDVVLLDADLKVAQGVTLQDLVITFNTGSSYSGGVAGQLSNDFSSLKLVIGNSVVSTFTPSSSTVNGFTFEGSATVTANTTFKILGNLRTNASGKYKLQDVSLSNFSIKEYTANGNSIQNNQVVGSAGAVATTVGSAKLTMTRNDGIANQPLTVGSVEQTLTQFTIRANDVSDVNVTKLRFASTGSTNVSLSNVTNVKLMINGSTVSTKNMTTGYADFNDINVKVPKNTDVTVKVVADFSTAITNGQVFQLGLDTIEATDSNSIVIASANITAPSNGVLYTFSTAGSSTATINSSSPNSLVLAPSSTETEVARYTLGAIDDTLQLTDLYLYNTGTSDLSSAIKSIGLYDTAGNKLAGGSVLGTGTVQFSLGSSSTFEIPKNTSNTVVVVKAAFNDITDAAQTNKTVQLAIGTLSGVTPVDGTVNGLRLVSKSTGNASLTNTVTTAVSKSHLLLRTKPTVAIVGTAGTLTTHTFSVTADANNKLTLNGTTISLSNPSNTGGTFTVYKDTENSGNEVSTGTIAANGTITSSYFTPTEISAGTTKTFIFKVSNEITVNPSTNQTTRIFRVTNVNFDDMMNTGGNVNVSSVSTYSNVGLPTVEQTFTH